VICVLEPIGFIAVLQTPDSRIRALRNTDNSERRNPPDDTAPAHLSSLYTTQLLVGPLRRCMEDVWCVCGYIMRLYRDREVDERMRVVGMVGKKEVRKWLEENAVGR